MRLKQRKFYMQKKFQPNDKVFYIIEEDDEDCKGIYICYVVAEDLARKYYSGMGKTKATIESCAQRSFKDYNCNPVFIVAELGSASIAWMPENELYLFTPIAKVLFQK